MSLFDLNPNIKLICLSAFVFFFGNGLFTFVLPVYITKLNASPTDVGLLYAAFYLSWGITILLGGILTDRFDPKKIMIINSVLWIPVPLALALAINWQQLWLPMILYGTFFEGPAVCVYILRSASSGKVMLAFGMWSASTALGSIFSPLIGGTLFSVLGKQAVFTLAGIFYTASILPLFFLKKIKKTEKQQKETIFQIKAFKTSKLIAFCSFFTATMFSIFLLSPFIPQFTHAIYHQTIFDLGIFGTAISIGAVFFSVALGKIGDKKSKMFAVVLSILISVISFLLIVTIDNFALLCVSFFLSGASTVVIFLMSGVIGAVAPEHLAGRWIAIGQACVTFAGVGAPILGGILYQISPYLAFTTTILILSSLVVFGLVKKL